MTAMTGQEAAPRTKAELPKLERRLDRHIGAMLCARMPDGRLAVVCAPEQIEEIAHRCNVHDELATALRGLIPADMDEHVQDFAPEWIVARNALALAEGRAEASEASEAEATNG